MAATVSLPGGLGLLRGGVPRLDLEDLLMKDAASGSPGGWGHGAVLAGRVWRAGVGLA